jgi:cytochrome c biogenesis protein CcmG/thiol:disulfide interchange protein DsbE
MWPNSSGKRATIVGFGVVILTCATLRAERALPFSLPSVEGTRFVLEEELGKGPLVFDFWATWCKPCIKSLPGLQAIANEYARHRVKVFTINIDGPRNESKIRLFMRRYRLELPVLLDKTNALMKQFHFVAPPATLVITPNGEVVYRREGYKRGDEATLRRILDLLVGGR